MALKIGDKLTLTISDVAFGGEGVARVDNFVAFVPFVISGEVVEAEITELKKNYARGRLVRLIEASPERVAPACRYFGACGGCQYQHISYPAQLRLKHKQVVDLFQRIGGLSPERIMPVVACPQPYGYRNRIMVRSQWDKFKQRLNIGFLRYDCRLVVDIEECKIAEPAINAQLTQVRANPPPRGGLKVVLRIAPEDWEVPRDSFFQNNFFLLQKLVEVVREQLSRAGTRHLVDLYCGVGFFGIELADKVTSVVGVESDLQAVKAARKNAERRGRSNVEFVAASVSDALPEVLRRYPAGAATVLLDPPRKGCLPEALELLRRERPAQIIYVSCHPATMARDLKILCHDGLFELVCVRPLDMFPQTKHIECVADLRSGAFSATGAVTQKWVLPKIEADGGPLTQKWCYPI